MENPNISPSLESIGLEKKFKTPQEELEFLRAEIAKKNTELEQKSSTENIVEKPNEAIVGKQVHEYQKKNPEDILEKDYKLSEKHTDEIALKLSPEKHDDKMAELLWIVQQKGVRNAMSVVEKMNDAHIVDDFHRFIVEYIKEGFSAVGVKEKSPLWKQLHMTLFEISLPQVGTDENKKEKPLKELISSMEQLYAGMLSISGQKKTEKNHMAFEIAVSEKNEEVIFYVAIPDKRKELFEKQILSIFPQAKVIENKDDYNIFNQEGVSVGAYGKFARNKIYPLKMYDTFDYDPLNILLSSFSKLAKDGEGASVQIILSPAGDTYTKKYKNALDQIQKGRPAKKVIDMPDTISGEFFKEMKEFFNAGFSKQKKEEGSAPPIVDQILVEQITNKISSPIAEINLRIVASANSQQRADEILSDIEAVFNQFEEAKGNALKFKRLKKGALKAFLRDFSYRRFIEDQKMPFNLKEITTIYHFPSVGISSSRELKQSKAGTAPAPLNMPEDGVLLGINKYRNSEIKIHITREDRLRHFYTIGQTGTGKTTLLKNMIVQDIKAGDGVCMIDPHGSDIQDVLSLIPKERYEDVIYFDPGYTKRPMALNMLEYDTRYPEQKTFVVNEMFNIFDKLYDLKTTGGPMFEQYFRNSALLIIEDPDSGNTLLDVARVLGDKSFRDMKLSRSKNPIINQFWINAEQTTGDQSLANFVPYITSKFDIFLANDIMRPIIAQSKSSFNFRKIMDEKKILLVNLAKGRLGDINAHLIGLILVGKILMSALSRVDKFGQGDLPDFYLYLDEFQNITTDSIATILSEARKYKLGLTIAHQFIAQLDDKIKNAVFGNVGSICSFRVGADDAEYLKNQFEPVFSTNDIMNIDNRNAYLKLLVDGRPAKPFNIETITSEQGSSEIAENLKQLSHLTYGRDREKIEEEIMERYK